MTEIAKLRILTFLFLTAFLTILLAGNLTPLELKPGIPLPDMTQNSGTESQTAIPNNGTVSAPIISKAILGFFLVGCLVFVLVQMVRTAAWNRKTTLKAILYIAVGSLVVGGVLYLILGPHGRSDSGEVFTAPTAIPAAGPELGAVPPFLLWIAWIGLAGSIILFAVWFAHRRKESKPAVDRVQFAAEEAVLAITHGRDFKSAILRCYRQMSLVLHEEQGIELGPAMTAREFENLLEQRGIPPDPVQEITKLFEFARYGNGSSSPEEEIRALNCLNSIAQYCRETERRA